MGKCVNHPEKETGYLCSKYGRYLCDDCLECRDPKLYCKFRSACAIWFLGKGAQNLEQCTAEDNSGTGDDAGDGICIMKGGKA